MEIKEEEEDYGQINEDQEEYLNSPFKIEELERALRNVKEKLDIDHGRYRLC